jgi:hypothetical protein
VAQLIFTYVPFLPRLFESRPVALADGALIVGANVALMLILEARLWPFSEFLSDFNRLAEAASTC